MNESIHNLQYYDFCQFAILIKLLFQNQTKTTPLEDQIQTKT